MKKSIIGAVIASSLIMFTTSATAGGIGFANVQNIFETSPLGKAKISADEKKLKPQMDELKKNITALQNKIKSFAKQKDNVEAAQAKGDKIGEQTSYKSEMADKKQAQNDLEKAIKEYQNLISQVQKIASDDAETFKDALTKASTEIAKEKQLDAILPAEISLYNISSTDVSKDIIAKMQ